MVINKKLILSSLLVIIFSFSVLFIFQPTKVSADSTLLKTVSDGGLAEIGSTAYGSNSGNVSDPRTVVLKLIRVFLGFLGIIFLIFTVYAGYLYMTAQRSEEKIEKAVGMIKTGVIGLIIVLAAFSIAGFVTEKTYKAVIETR